ncbi:MAG: CRISPR-associated helicase Cas3' [Oscillospiraceae bacterium]|nr:CRISPR-associated helicase Cas3' [Oscillospiraceae bacterium]
MEHSRGSANHSRMCLQKIGLGEAGYLSGLIHDMGKMKQEFYDYLMLGQGTRGSVNHTFAGCRFFLEHFHGKELGPEALTAELMACAVGGHHGLFDCIDEDGRSGFLHRLEKDNIGYAESRDNFLEQCASISELDERFSVAHTELMSVYERLASLTEDGEEYAFYLGLVTRLLTSAVIEGDRRDTSEFMSDIEYPKVPEDLPSFWSRYLERVEEKLGHFPQDTPVRRARKAISQRCRDFADEPGGIYRLNVPTGAGKTLGSLRYALAHAKKWGKQRLIFTSPLLSILEQNAAVIREYLGDDTIILEHHSNVVRTEETNDLDLRELAVESWHAPVIITTLVQLLDTLFDGRTTTIRRFQGLCNSVIVIDEVQTVPNRMLTLFDMAVDFLSEICGATVLLCSATQPCLEQTEHPLRTCRGQVVPYDESIWSVFRRNEITDSGAMALEQIGAFARELMEEVGSLLIVCNKKSEAEDLFRALEGSAKVCRHLSASMCIDHRRRTLAELMEALESGKTCLCVSTQVIEAGVDISFARVIRLAAGLDSVIQAAGRCNRHGESEIPVPVYLVRCSNERLSGLQEIEDGKKATISLLEAFRRDPSRFDGDISSDRSVAYYYNRLYGAMSKGAQDYTLRNRQTSLFQLLAYNLDCYDPNGPYAGRYMLNQAFRTAGAAFQVFDDETQDVVVPYAYVGFLHRDRPGRTSLALDLMEELRPCIADRFVLTLINDRIMTAADLQQSESGAVRLTEDGRKKFLKRWQERKQETITHPYLEEKLPWGLVPYIQALLLARYLRGDLDAYPPFLWK